MKTILITAIGSFSAETAIHSLKRQGCRVIGCDIYPPEWVVNSTAVDRFYQAPYASDHASYLDFIVKLCEREAVDGILPLTDVEIDVLTDSVLRQRQPPVLLISGGRTIGICRDKKRLADYLAPLKLCKLIPGLTLSQARAAELDYPVVVKPLNGRSSQGLEIIRDKETFEHRKSLDTASAANYLVQKKIDGLVITVDVVRSPDSGQTVCLPRKELLRTRNGCGTTVYLFSDVKLEQQCRDIAGALNICGCVNFEFIEDDAGERYFLECNPRFSGGLAFSCMSGYDMVRNHMRCFTGERLDEQPQVKPRYLARRYAEYLMKIEAETDKNENGKMGEQTDE